MQLYMLLATACSRAGAAHASIAPATLYWGSSPVGPNETALVAGANFPAEPIVLLRSGSSQHGSDTAAAEPVVIEPLQVTQSGLKFVIPSDLKLWSYTAQVCSKHHSSCSNQLPLNVADVWWFAGDAGNSSTTGGWLRLFGTSMDFTGYKNSSGTAGRVAMAEERLQHALRSYDHAAIQKHSAELSALLGGDDAAGGGADAAPAGPELRLQFGSSATPVVIRALNFSLWDATFALPTTLKPGEYSLATRNAFQSNWSKISFYQPGNRDVPIADSVQINAAPTTTAKTFAVADYMAAFGIPSHGLNYTTGAPVNGTGAVVAALTDAAKAGDELDKVVLLPIGKLFIDGGLSIPPRTILRGTAQDKSTLYFMEDGIGTQLGGLTVAEGGSPTPDPGYIYGNHTAAWGVEHLSIYVTHFSNTVIWVAESSGFVLRSTLIRQLPYFCSGCASLLLVLSYATLMA